MIKETCFGCSNKKDLLPNMSGYIRCCLSGTQDYELNWYDNMKNGIKCKAYKEQTDGN